MSMFTNGEWVIQRKSGAKSGTTIEIFAVSEDDEETLPVKVARVLNDNKQIPPEQREANARLIAAAPDMYELLYEAMQDLQHYETKLSYKKTMWELIEEELNRIDGKEINP